VIVCPRCGADAEPGQEYCLTCGHRLPGLGLERPDGRLAGWQRRSAIALVVAVAGAAVAIAASEPGAESTAISTATGEFAAVPTTSTLPSPAESPGATTDWPAGEDGWTIALVSVPQTKGRRLAAGRAAQARREGLPQVGILDSSRYASLHPGYWVVFSGVYSSEVEATSALEPARRVARTATVRRVVP
jgi:hypothetical protein